MTYPLSAEQIRRKRLQRDLSRFTATAERLAFERRVLLEEYERVSEIYARHLERLKAKMDKILAEQQALSAQMEQYITSHQERSLPGA